MDKDKHLNEILGNHIPADEAKVLSNGRITCLICLHRPVFDTLSVLASHRKGKKHVSELEKYLQRKEELKFIELKKKHKLLIKNKTDSSLGFSKNDIKFIKYKRRQVLEVPPLSSTAAVNNYKTTSKPDQLKSYLNKIHKKPSFKDSLERIKSKYNVVKNQEKGTSSSSLGSEINENRSTATNVNHEIELKMSGWLKDSSGNWVKDPDAEFDSDDSEPPSSSLTNS